MNRKPGVWATVVAVALMVALSAWAAPDLPEQVPTHFTLDGRADAYGSSLQVLVLLPLVAAGLGALLYALPAIDPRREHLAQSAKAYNATWMAALVVLVAVHAMVLLAGLGYDVPIPAVVSVLIGILFIVIGNYMGKIRSNWFFGIRTPWTLTSERSWYRTHRLVGRLFAALGMVTLVCAAVAPRLGPVVLGGGAALILVVSFGYSYWVWRNDADRGAPESTVTS